MVPGELSGVVDKAEAALLASDLHPYQRGSELVRVGGEHAFGMRIGGSFPSAGCVTQVLADRQ